MAKKNGFQEHKSKDNITVKIINIISEFLRNIQKIVLDVTVALLLPGLIIHVFLKIAESNVNFFLEMSKISFTLLGLTIIGITLNSKKKLKKDLLNISKSSITATISSLVVYFMFPIFNQTENKIMTGVLLIFIIISSVYFWLTIKELYQLITNQDDSE